MFCRTFKRTWSCTEILVGLWTWTGCTCRTNGQDSGNTQRCARFSGYLRMNECACLKLCDENQCLPVFSNVTGPDYYVLNKSSMPQSYPNHHRDRIILRMASEFDQSNASSNKFSGIFLKLGLPIRFRKQIWVSDNIRMERQYLMTIR